MRIEKRLREKAFTIVYIVHENRFELCYRHRATKEELAPPVQEWKHIQIFGYFNTYEDAKALMDRLLKVEWVFIGKNSLITTLKDIHRSPFFNIERVRYGFDNDKGDFMMSIAVQHTKLYPLNYIRYKTIRDAQIVAYDIMVKGGLI